MGPPTLTAEMVAELASRPAVVNALKSPHEPQSVLSFFFVSIVDYASSIACSMEHHCSTPTCEMRCSHYLFGFYLCTIQLTTVTFIVAD